MSRKGHPLPVASATILVLSAVAALPGCKDRTDSKPQAAPVQPAPSAAPSSVAPSASTATPAPVQDEESQIAALVAQSRTAFAKLGATVPKKGGDADPSVAVSFDKEYQGALTAIESAKEKMNRQAEAIMKPVDTEARRLEALAQTERGNLTDLIVANLRQSGKGYIGVDQYSEQEVYIETANAPERVGNTMVYLPIQGSFRRDGDVPVTNKLGAAYRIPRFTDARSDTAAILEINRARIKVLRKNLSDGLDSLPGTALQPWQEARTALVDRLTSDAQQRARSLYDQAHARALGTEHADLKLLADTRRDLEAGLSGMTEKLSTSLSAARRLRDEAVAAVGGSKLLGEFDEAAKPGIQAEAQTRLREITDATAKAVEPAEPPLDAQVTTLVSALRDMVAKPGMRAEIATRIQNAGDPDPKAIASVRASLRASLDKLRSDLGDVLRDAPTLSQIALGTCEPSPVLEGFDEARRAYRQRLRTAVGDATRRTIDARAKDLGLSECSADFIPRAFFPDGSRLIAVGATSTVSRSQVLAVLGGAVSGGAPLAAPVEEVTPLALWRANDFACLRVADRTLIFKSDLGLVGTFSGIGEKDIYAGTRGGLLLAAAMTDAPDRAYLWAIKPTGELTKATEHQVQPGVTSHDGRVSFVLTRDREDCLLTIDADGSGRSTALDAALNLINGIQVKGEDWQSGHGPHPRFRISGGHIWVFAPNGIERLGSGPTLVELRADGTYGTPLFAHTGGSLRPPVRSYEKQPVGDHAMIVWDTVLGQLGAVVVGNMGSEAQLGPYGAVMLGYDGRQLWGETFQVGALGRFPSSDDLVTAGVTKNEAALRAIRNAPLPVPSSSATADRTWSQLNQEFQPLHGIAEFHVQADGRGLVLYAASDTLPTSDKPKTLPAFVHEGWVYFGDTKLSAVKAP